MTAERKPSTIDDYLKSVPEDRRRALEDLRAKIRSIVPGAEECISYRIAAFRLNGVVVAGFRTTLFPAASAGATLCATVLSGELNGVMAPTDYWEALSSENNARLQTLRSTRF